MKNIFTFSRVASVLALLVVLAGVMVTGKTSPAHAAPPAASALAAEFVKVDLWGEVERDGKAVELTPDVRVNPGEVITWNVRVDNRGQSWVAGVNAVGQIPQGTSFVSGSAGGDGVTAVAYSIDGGANFSARPTVIKDGKEVPASTDSYNAIRLTFGDRIEGGASKVAHYRTLVR